MTPSLSETLEPPSTTVNGRSGFSVALDKALTSFSTAACGGRQIGGNVVVGALSAVDHAEAIGNEGLAEGGDLLGVSGAFVGVLRGLLRVETNVLKQHNVAIVHGGDPLA